MCKGHLTRSSQKLCQNTEWKCQHIIRKNKQTDIQLRNGPLYALQTHTSPTNLTSTRNPLYLYQSIQTKTLPPAFHSGTWASSLNITKHWIIWINPCQKSISRLMSQQNSTRELSMAFHGTPQTHDLVQAWHNPMTNHKHPLP
jgi:hypothetical protein